MNEWVNDGIIFIFGWTIPLSCQSDDRRHVEDSVRQDYHHSVHLVPSKYDTIDYRVNLQTTICRSSVFVRSSKASVSATFDLWLLFTSKAVSQHPGPRSYSCVTNSNPCHSDVDGPRGLCLSDSWQKRAERRWALGGQSCFSNRNRDYRCQNPSVQPDNES